ncbi:MAG TPA: zinc ABC transporter substrate-binding protein [Paenirhodobacter sp.]
MLKRRTLMGASAALALMFATGAQAQQPLKVVASFSILGDFVSQVGGDRIALTTLVGPDGDAHVYQPSPNDAKAVAGADLVVVNGLGFEGWLDRLIEASGYKSQVAVATTGITPRAFTEDDHDEEEGHQDHTAEEHDHGATDPHAWQSVPNARIYVANIARALGTADPAGAAIYAANAAAYTAELDAMDARIVAAIAALPRDRRTIVTSHDAFGYFAATYGMTFEAPQGLSTDAEASAKDVAELIQQIKSQKIGAVFVENITDPRLLQQIAAESGAKIGGTLYSDALSTADGPAATYLAMMRNNIAQLSAALTE